MHALLITGGTIEKRTEAIEQTIHDWKIGKNDIVILALSEDATSIGIGQVRDFQKRLVLKPYESAYTVGVIHDMNTLTIEAQNALLKTLEEPPPHTRIIGETATDGALLPTVLSRMQRMSLTTDLISETASHEAYALLEELLKLSAGKRLARIEPHTATKEAAMAWIDATIVAWEARFSKEHDVAKLATLARALRLFITARNQLTSNVNHRLAIDNAVLEI